MVPSHDISYKNLQYYKFSAYGFLKNLRFFDSFLLLYLHLRGFSYTEIGTLYAVRSVCTYIMEIPSGVWADTYGRKTSLVVSFLLFIVSFIIYYLGKNFWVLTLGMIFFGIADAFRSGSNKAMIVQYLNKHGWQNIKSEYYGRTRSWSQLGSALSSILAGIFVLYTSQIKYIFLLSILPYMLNLVNVMSYPNELNLSNSSLKEKHNSIRIELRNLFHNLKNPAVFKVMNTSAFFTAYLKSCKDYLQTIVFATGIFGGWYWLSKQGEEAQSGLEIGIFYFFIYCLTSVASKNAARFQKFIGPYFVHLSMLMGLSCGVLSGLFYGLHCGLISIILFVCIFLIENIRKPVLVGLIAEEADEQVMTSVVSTQSSYSSILAAIFSVFIGIFVDYFGIGYGIMIFSCGAIFIYLFLNKITTFTDKRIKS